DQVVEVERLVLRERLRVAVVDGGDALLPEALGVAGIAALVDQLALRGRDRREERPRREALLVNLHVLEDAAHDADLVAVVEDREARVDASDGPVLPEDPRALGM